MITITTAATVRNLANDADSVRAALAVTADLADAAYARRSGPDETDLGSIRQGLEIARRVAARLAHHLESLEREAQS